MAKLIDLVLAALIAVPLFSGTASPSAAQAAGRLAVRDLTWPQLEQELRTNKGPIVIEFYRQGDPDDPDIADDCDKCAQQLPVLEKIASQYAGRVTFLRFDVQARPQMEQFGMVVFPTHIFMVHNDKELWARRIRGFLTEKQFEELIEELFNIKP